MELAEAQTVVAGMTGYIRFHPDAPGEVTLDSQFTLRELTAVTVVLQDAVATRVREVIAEQIGMTKDEVTPEKALIADLGCDENDKVEVLMAVEDAFLLDVIEPEKLVTVQDVIDYVQKSS